MKDINDVARLVHDTKSVKRTGHSKVSKYLAASQVATLKTVALPPLKRGEHECGAAARGSKVGAHTHQRFAVFARDQVRVEVARGQEVHITNENEQARRHLRAVKAAAEHIVDPATACVLELSADDSQASWNPSTDLCPPTVNG